MVRLTPRQADVFRMICGFVDVNGRAPTRREIAEALHVSDQSVDGLLAGLRARDAVTYERSKPATLQILTRDYEVAATTNRGRTNDCDVQRVKLRTTPGPDGHDHVAEFSAEGNGRTTPGPDGHVHRVHWLDILTTNGHGHQLTEERVA